MKTSVREEALPAGLMERLRKANVEVTAAYPGESDRRQPVHTVYGGAQLFKAAGSAKLGEVALKSMNEYAPDAVTFARAFGMPEGWMAPGGLAHKVYERVVDKLKREAVEDFRIDFEDGYGNRPDAEEDGHAVQAAHELAAGMAQKSLPPFIGIRIKTFSEELRARSFRTLDLFVTALCEKTKGALPDNFVVTLPKITAPEQVEALVAMLEVLEKENRLPAGSLKIELMVETTQSIFLPDGRTALPTFVALCKGRCTGAHFGTYDYTALVGITAAHQRMVHPACDFAKHVMKVSLAGTTVALSDGATNVMPIPPHRGEGITAEQKAENRAVVHRAWKLAYDATMHSLEGGFYQGWDLHPAQLVARYAAMYAFFLDGLNSAGNRLKSFMDKAAQATLHGDVFDDAATGQGLLNYFLRAVSCGALTAEEAERISGLTAAEQRTRSFNRILAGRRKS